VDAQGFDGGETGGMGAEGNNGLVQGREVGEQKDLRVLGGFGGRHKYNLPGNRGTIDWRGGNREQGKTPPQTQKVGVHSGVAGGLGKERGRIKAWKFHINHTTKSDQTSGGSRKKKKKI